MTLCKGINEIRLILRFDAAVAIPFRMNPDEPWPAGRVLYAACPACPFPNNP